MQGGTCSWLYLVAECQPKYLLPVANQTDAMADALSRLIEPHTGADLVPTGAKHGVEVHLVVHTDRDGHAWLRFVGAFPTRHAGYRNVAHFRQVAGVRLGDQLLGLHQPVSFQRFW